MDDLAFVRFLGTLNNFVPDTGQIFHVGLFDMKNILVAGSLAIRTDRNFQNVRSLLSFPWCANIFRQIAGIQFGMGPDCFAFGEVHAGAAGIIYKHFVVRKHLVHEGIVGVVTTAIGNRGYTRCFKTMLAILEDGQAMVPFSIACANTLDLFVQMNRQFTAGKHGLLV